MQHRRLAVVTTVVLGVGFGVDAATFAPFDERMALNQSSTTVPDFIPYEGRATFEIEHDDICTNVQGHVDAAGIEWKYDGDLHMPVAWRGRDTIDGTLVLSGATGWFTSDDGVTLPLKPGFIEGYCTL